MKEQSMMADPETIAMARELVSELEAGNELAVNDLLDTLSRRREQGLFVELGKLTRELHEALNNFQVDSRIATLTESDIPDAKERLNHVISMTEESAHKTLNAVDQSLPIAEELQQRATDLHDKWSRFRQKNMVLDEFRALVPEIDSFLELTTHHAGTLNANLSEVMMAQGFQDLTGQIIRRVINLVTEVEDNLVHLIRISGQHFKDAAPEPGAEEKDISKGYGPQVPGVDAGTEVVNSQDDVDELLSSLGF